MYCVFSSLCFFCKSWRRRLSRTGGRASMWPVPTNWYRASLRILSPCAWVSSLFRSFAAHSLALRLGQLLVQVAQLLLRDVLLFVDVPNLVLPFLGDASIFRLLNLEL